MLEDAQRYVRLMDDIGWKHLIRKFEEKKESLLSSLTRRLWRGEEVTQREIDFQRGYYHGIEDLLEDPGKVMDQLELAGRLAWLRVQLKADEVEGEEEPYA